MAYLIDVRQQGLVFVVEQLYGALLYRADERERAVRPPDQRQVEAERAVVEEIFLRHGVRSLQDLIAVGEPAEPLYHRDVSVKDFVEDVQWVVRRQLFHRARPLLHAQKLVVQRLGVCQRQA